MTRKAHPLLGVFPLSVMTLAAFLIVLVILMARLHAGLDPALHAVANGPALARNGRRDGAIVTRTSGIIGGSGVDRSRTVGGGGGEGGAAILTRTSATATSEDDGA